MAVLEVSYQPRNERRYREVEPENRLGARTLEAEWEKRLGELAAAESELVRKQQAHPLELTENQHQQIRALATDLKQAWDAPTTTARDRKELLQGLLEEVKIEVLPEDAKAHLVLRWKTGELSQLDVLWRIKHVPPIRTAEDTIDWVRRLALHHPDAIIAGGLNSQGRKTATGERFTADKVGNLRTETDLHRSIHSPFQAHWHGPLARTVRRPAGRNGCGALFACEDRFPLCAPLRSAVSMQ